MGVVEQRKITLERITLKVRQRTSLEESKEKSLNIVWPGIEEGIGPRF